MISPTSALDLSPPAMPAAAPKPATPARRQRVLLLDDQDDFREIIRDYLTARFYDVTEVSNGTDGLRATMKDTYDLIVCDMMMPQVGGEMFYWAVTRVRPAARLRFLFVTGHQNDAKVQAFFNRISATVLVKPFKLEALVTSLVEIDRKLR